MFGGNFPGEDDDDEQQQHFPPVGGAGRGAGSFLASLAAGLAGGAFAGQHLHGTRAPARAYDEYFKAYSVAMLPGKARPNVNYGGKIIMPQSALANLSSLEIESPWMFKLQNPSNQAATTHAGVLEFIAEEGCVHLPYWMMKALRLEEGDPIRVTGVKLPKGKFIKVQPQQKYFLEVSDPKALLEQALRNFSCLTAGDIVELQYNSMVLDFLIMDIQPPGSGINVVDTDLEVDFAPPVGYVEPPRPAPPPPETMASKLKIDVNSSTPGSSRPGSALGGAVGTAPTGEFEVFKGLGNTLNGRKTKGKGKKPTADDQPNRANLPTIVTNEMLNGPRRAPAPLNLPFGKLFFGFIVIPHRPPTPEGAAPGSSASQPQPSAFGGGPGHTLSGRTRPAATQPPASASTRTNASSGPSTPLADDKWKGKGNTLADSRSKQKARPPPRSPSPEYIDVDSD